MEVKKMCVVCQNPAELMCSRCLEVYCSVQCQIEDWEEHKKVCIAVPKLIRNSGYVKVLTRGVPLALPNSIEPVGSQMMHSSRALKPMRNPNIPAGTIEVSLNREATAKLSEPVPEPVSKSIVVTAIPSSSVSESVQRLAKLKLQEVELKEQIQPKAVTEPVAKPQTLANLKIDIIKNHQQMAAAAKAADQPAAASEPKATPQSKAWLLPFPLEKPLGEPFEVIVQCLVQPNRAWVMLASYEAECDKLLYNINQQLGTAGEPVKYAEIQVNDIFAAPYDNCFYRVVVLAKSDPSKSLLKVRLIDYGNEVVIPSTELRPPLLLMKNLRAFAFQVEIVNLSHPLELNERIRIKVTDAEEKDGRKMVEIVQPPLKPYVLSMLGTGEDKFGEGGIIAILSSRTALVMLTSAAVKPTMKVLYNQLPDVASKQFSPVADKPKVGDLICIDAAEVGWSRGVVVEQYANNWLVYTVDNGTVELVTDEKQIRLLPEEYKQKPHLVLQMDLSKVVMNEMEFKQRCYMPGFAFSFERLSYDGQTHTLKAMLRDAEGKRQLAEVVFKNFVCDLRQIDINYWPYIPQDKCVVRITSVLNVSTVIACPKDKINIYTELLQTMMPTLKGLTALPKCNEVIVGVDDIEMPYRARVLKNVSQTEVEVLDLDNGSIKAVPFDKLYAANGFIANLPVFPMKVQIRDLDTAAVKDPEIIIDQLKDLKATKRTLRQLFEGKSYMFGVKLIDLNTNRSLGTLLMEHHDKKICEREEAARAKAEAEKLKREQEEEAVRAAKAKQEAEEAHQKAEIERKKREEEEARLKAAQAEEETAKKAALNTKLCYSDLKMVQLPAGTANVKLTILDDSNLSHAVLTVCEYTNENVERYKKLDQDVNKVAKAIGGDGYDPEFDELCVAIYDADKMWYRAVCLQVNSGSYTVLFVDYGNIAVVKRESIRKMPVELNFPCAAHACTVKDINKALPKLPKQQAELGYVVAVEVLAEGEVYALKF